MVKSFLLTTLCGTFVALTASAAPNDIVRVDSSKILLNGQEFLSKGVIFEGFLEPVDWLNECLNRPLDENKQIINSVTADQKELCRRHLASRHYYFGQTGSYTVNGVETIYNYGNGLDALTVAQKNWNINTVRFNLNQAALDPGGSYYSANYITEVTQIVARARARNLVVVLALFDYSLERTPDFFKTRNPKRPIDTDVSLRAIRKLSSMFGKDQGVFLEFLNEPFYPAARDLSLAIWLNGGTVGWKQSPWYGIKFVGVNQMIQAARQAGSLNPLIVQGMGATLHEIPLEKIKDPLNKLVYSAHTFLNNLNWFKRFGLFAKKGAVLITAWEGASNKPWCQQYGLSKAEEYIEFIKENKIGLIVYAMDVPYTSTRNFEKTYDLPTAYPVGVNCTDRVGRAGTIIQEYFNNVLMVPARMSSALNAAVPLLSNTGAVVSSIKGSKRVRAGETVKLSLALYDPERDPVNVRVWWADGVISPSAIDVYEAQQEISQNQFTSYSNLDVSHVYRKPGRYSVSIVTFDGKGKRNSYTEIIEVL